MITVSAEANQAMQQILEAENKVNHSVRISVVPGGCSGFEYKFDIVEESQKGDLPAPTQNGVKVLVDPGSLKYIDGSELDYVTSQLGGKFEFKNPNSTHDCGCGKSFGVE